MSPATYIVGAGIVLVLVVIWVWDPIADALAAARQRKARDLEHRQARKQRQIDRLETDALLSGQVAALASELGLRGIAAAYNEYYRVSACRARQTEAGIREVKGGRT